MMPDTLKSMLNRRPYEPMRIKLSSGEIFEIRHPEMTMLTKSALVVSLLEPDGSPSDRFEVCSYLHIASVETLSLSPGRAA